MNIAVTGGFGSGKSTASRMLAVSMQAEHLDTDQLCRQQMQQGKPGYDMFTKVFGQRFLFADGALNKQLLREVVFTDRAVKMELESILHPLVRQEVAEYYRHCCASGKNLVVEVPLLFESGWQHDFAVWVVVSVPEEQSFNRVVLRDGMAPGEIQLVYASQWPLAEKLKYAHFVIDNSGTFVSMAQQVAWLGRKLQDRENNRKCEEVSH